MATKKTTGEEGGWGNGLALFLETISGGMHQVVSGALDTFEHKTHQLFRKLLRSFGFFFFSVLGAVFLLIGTARMLDTLYQLPGLGEIIVGAVVFAGALLFSRMDHQK